MYDLPCESHSFKHEILGLFIITVPFLSLTYLICKALTIFPIGTIIALVAITLFIYSLRYLQRTTESPRPPLESWSLEQPWIPPKSWTAHRSQTVSCRCSTVADTKEIPVGMDTLISDSFHNMTCSQLCQLPDELVLEIMKLLDPLSVQCLRRTSRLFLRLYCSTEFSASHDIGYKLYLPFLPWQQPKNEYWSKKQLIPMLQRDRKEKEYCNDCRATWKSPTINKKLAELTTKHLHCSGCQMHHPRVLFSKAQRTVAPDVRMCIGHEGSVRLCDHKVVTWADVVSNFPSNLAKLANTGTENRDEIQETWIERLVKECKDKSHTPQSHDFPPAVSDLAGINPSAIIEGYSKDKIELILRWTGHLSLLDHDSDELDINREVTPEIIHEKLGQIRGGVAEHIVPEVPPGRLIEMNCFDPNQCCCLHYPGLDKLPRNWELTPPHEIQNRACRVDETRCLRPLQPLHNNEDKPYIRNRLLGNPVIDRSHQTVVTSLGGGRKGSADIKVMINSCNDKYRCLKVNYERALPIKLDCCPLRGPTLAWYQALDPDSYRLREDNESFGIAWCLQLGCPNYYRYLKPLPVPIQEMYQDCRPDY